jgi:hypothetical protein
MVFGDEQRSYAGTGPDDVVTDGFQVPPGAVALGLSILHE